MAADGSIIIDTSIDQAGADRDLKSLQGKLESTGNSIKKLGSTLTKSITLPIIGAGVASAKFAMDQEQSFAKVSTLLDSSETDFGEYKEAIRTASSEMGVSFDEYAESVYGSISAGVDAGNAIEFVATAAKLAKGGFTDTATAVDVMTTAINAYGLEQSEAGRISDMLINTQNLGKTTVDELASSMGAVIPIANANAISMEQLSTGYAILTKNGVATSEAGTQLKAMFGELGKSGSITDKVLREKLGKSFKELSAEGMSTSDVLNVLAEDAEANGLSMGDMFGSMEAGNAAMTLIKDGGDEFNETLESMKNVGGETEQAFNKMENTATAKLGKAFNSLKNSLAALGDLFLPTITRIIEFITRMIDKFASLSPLGQKMVVVFSLIAAAIGPVVTFIGLLVAGAAGVAGMMATATAAGTTLGAVLAGMVSPFLIVIGVITAIIAIGVLLYKNWDTVKAKAIEVFTGMAPFLDVMKAAFQSLMDSVGPIWESLKTLFQSILPILQKIGVIIGAVLVTAFGIAISIFNATIAAIGPLINAFINVVDVIVNVVNAIIAVFTGDWQGAMDYWKAATDSTVAFVKNLFTAVVNFFSTFVESIIAFFYNLYMVLVGNSIIPDMVNAILLWFQNMATWVIETVSAFITGVITFFTNLWTMAQAVFTAGVAFIRTIISTGFNFIKTLIQTIMTGIQTVISTVWNFIKTVISTAINNIRTNISTVFNAIRTIVTTVLNAIRNTATTVWNNILNAIRTAVNNIRSTVTTVFNAVRSTISTVFNTIKSVISSAINTVKSTISNGFNAAKSTITSIMSSIKSTISNAWNSVKTAISNAITGIKTTIRSGFTAALDIVRNMGTKFKEAGSKIISMLADGIKGAVGKVTGAIGDITGKIRNFLPFSPAKEGPLDDIDHLNFDGPMVKSINKGKPHIQKAMEDMLQMPKINHSLAIAGNGSVNPVAGMRTPSNTTNDNRNVSITVDAGNLEELNNVIEMFSGLKQSFRKG